MSEHKSQNKIKLMAHRVLIKQINQSIIYILNSAKTRCHFGRIVMSRFILSTRIRFKIQYSHASEPI